MPGTVFVFLGDTTPDTKTMLAVMSDWPHMWIALARKENAFIQDGLDLHFKRVYRHTQFIRLKILSPDL